MKRNPFLIFLASIGILFLLFFMVVVVGIFSLMGKKPSIIRSDTIGIVNVKGIISESEPVLELIEQYKEEDHIKAVIVRINSPGGVVGPSQEIYQALKELRETKKVVASMGALGASGAYYIACGADRIVANPGTITGSIGVMMEFVNLQRLYKWAKMDGAVLKSGKYKDIGSPLRAMRADEKVLLNSVIKSIYQQFRNVVLEERKISLKEIDEMTDGRIFSGEQAQKLGLIDELGNFQYAVQIAANLAGIEDEPELYYPPKERRPLLRYFLGDAAYNGLQRLIGSQSVMSPFLYLLPRYQ